MAPPLRVGRLRASVLRSDRTGLKQQLIRGLWLSQAGGRERCGMQGEPAAEAGVTLQQPEMRHVFSRGGCPRITGPWQWRAAQVPGRGGVDGDLCLHTGFFVAAAAALAFHAPSLESALVATARTHLWSFFKRLSESPLLVHRETKRQEKVSCLFGSSRLFPGIPPGWLWCTSPLQPVFTPPTPVLSLGSDLRGPSLSSQPPPIPVGEQTSLSGW